MMKATLITFMTLLISQYALANGAFFVGAQGVYSAMQEDDVDPGIAFGGKAGYNMDRMNFGVHVVYNPLDEDNGLTTEGSDLFAMASADFYVVEGLFVSGKAGMVNRSVELPADDISELALAYGGGVGYSLGINKNFSVDFEANYLVAAETEADVSGTTVDLESTDYINGGVTLKFMF